MESAGETVCKVGCHKKFGFIMYLAAGLKNGGVFVGRGTKSYPHSARTKEIFEDHGAKLERNREEIWGL